MDETFSILSIWDAFRGSLVSSREGSPTLECLIASNPLRLAARFIAAVLDVWKAKFLANKEFGVSFLCGGSECRFESDNAIFFLRLSLTLEQRCLYETFFSLFSHQRQKGSAH